MHIFVHTGQFVTVDKALRKKYYYLNYLETDTWNKLNSQTQHHQHQNLTRANSFGDHVNGHTDLKRKLIKKMTNNNEDVNIIALENIGKGGKIRNKKHTMMTSSASQAKSPLEVSIHTII